MSVSSCSQTSADAAGSLKCAKFWTRSSCINAMDLEGKDVSSHGKTMEPLRPPVPLAMSNVAASCRTSRRQSGASSALRPFLNSFSALSWKVCHPLVSDSDATRHHCAGGARQSDANLECLSLGVLRDGRKVLDFDPLFFWLVAECRGRS